MVVLHVIIEPLWCSHPLHLSLYSAPSSCLMLQLNSIQHFAVENNHPLVPIVTIPYHIIYKSRHSYHLPIPKHPQFSRNTESYSRGAAFYFLPWEATTCVRFFSSSSRIVVVVAAAAWQNSSVMMFRFPSLTLLHHLNFLRLLLNLMPHSGL